MGVWVACGLTGPSGAGKSTLLTLLLRFIANKTQTEIAERVGISQMQVSRLLRRSLDQLRALTDAPSQAR